MSKIKLFFYGSNGFAWDHMMQESVLKSYIDHRIDQIRHVIKWTDLEFNHEMTTIIIPLMETHMYELYNIQIPALMPQLNALKTCHNKKNFALYIESHNLSHLIPRTFNNASEIDQDKVVVKRLTLNSARGISILPKAKINDSICKEFVVQELICGTSEYVSHLVVKNGTIIQAITYLHHLPSPDHLLGPICNLYNTYKIELEPEYLDLMEQVLKSLNYTGVCNVGFKLTPDKKIKILEINPRLGGSLMFKKHITDLATILNALISLILDKSE